MEGIVAAPEVAGRSRRHTSISFPCGRGTFCQHSVHPQDISSTFVRPSEHLSTFCAAAGPFMKICQLSVHAQKCSSVSGASRGFSSKYCCYNGIFVHFQCVDETFLQLLVWQRQLPSISSVATALSVNFLSRGSTLVRQQHFPFIYGLTEALPVH